MKLAVITDEISQDFEHALDIMGEFGVRSAELRGLWNINIADLNQEQIGSAKQALDQRKMSVCCLSTPVLKCDLPGFGGNADGALHLAQVRTLDDQPDLLRRCCEIANAFGAPMIRIFSGWYRKPVSPDVEDAIVSVIMDLIPIAERAGVTLVLENEHACFLRTGSETGRVLNRIGSPYVRGCWDAGNAFQAGEIPFPDGLDAMISTLAHVHVKDAVRLANGDMPWVAVGAGDVQFDKQFDRLREIGYDGHISLETHYRPESGSAEEGSIECLRSLRHMIREH